MSLKKIHTLVAVVALVGLSAFAYWWQHRAPAPKAVSAPSSAAPAAGGGAGGGGSAGPVSVEAGKVEAQALADDAQAVGTVRARQSVMLRPEVSGRIVKL